MINHQEERCNLVDSKQRQLHSKYLHQLHKTSLTQSQQTSYQTIAKYTFFIALIVILLICAPYIFSLDDKTTTKPPLQVQHNIQIVEMEQVVEENQRRPLKQAQFQIKKDERALFNQVQNSTFFCIINLQQKVETNYKFIIEQDLTRWQIVSFYQNGDSKNIQNIHYIKSNKNKGKNIYDAIVNHCPFHSIIMLLDSGEQLVNNNNILTQYQTLFKDQSVLAILTPYIQNDKLIKEIDPIFQFRRDQYFLGKRVQINLIKSMVMHMKVFRGSLYRKIPFINLMTEEQLFYQSQTSFLFPFLEMIHDLSPSNNKEVSDYLHHPLKIVKAQSPFFKTNNSKIKSYNVNEINEIGSKMRFRSIWQTASWVYLYKNRYPILWSQHNLNALKRKIPQDTERIPKLLHQIWIGGDIPYFKSMINDVTKNTLKHYEYRLWTQNDINQANFPITFTYIQNLYKINQRSKSSKLSMIADLMKYEIIYHHGGFYIDTNYQLKQPLDHLRKYPFIGIIQTPQFFGQYLASSFFAAEKKSIYLQRLLSRKNLDDVKYQSDKANIQTGPLFLGKGFTLEDYFYDIKVLEPEKIYPFMYWAKDKRWAKNKCTYSQFQAIPSSIYQKYDKIIYVKQMKLLYPCKLYEGSYGTDHWNLGGTWIKK